MLNSILVLAMGKEQLLHSHSRESETPGEFIKPELFNSLPSEKANDAIYERSF